MTTKQLLSLYAFLMFNIFSIALNAQDKLSVKDDTEVVSLNKIKIYLIGFGYEREQKLTSFRTIYLSASIENVSPFFPVSNSGSDVISGDKIINMAPVLSIGLRNYNNLKERKNSGKTTTNNSAGFVGVDLSLISPILFKRNYNTKFLASLSPVFGFQKSISKHTNLELSAGPSIQSDFTNHRIFGFIKFGINLI